MKEIIQLADDKGYTISTLNMGDLVEIEKKFGSLQVDMNKIENITYWLWLALRKEQPDMKINDLYSLIDAPFIASGKMNAVFESLSKVNGWDKMPKNEPSPAGKKQA